MSLSPEALWRRAREVSETARASGALQPIATDCEVVTDHGIAFQLRRAHRIDRKDAVASRQARDPDFNPFLPYDDALFVADLSPTHVCLLNKFNVIDRHLLIVTRAFVDQRAPITPADFAALAACMEAVDGLGFYNAGAEAGASQPHRHLQLVGPLGPGPARAPTEDAIIAGATAFGFRCAVIPIDFSTGGAGLHGAYLELTSRLGIAGAAAYNLLVTRDWMLLVPRTREHSHSIGVNALGFAGSFLVRDERQVHTMRTLGPLEVLRGVTEPPM